MRGLGIPDGTEPIWPNIEQRVQKLELKWRYQYDSIYRGLSAWQHGDASRLMTSEFLADQGLVSRDRRLYETIVTCVGAHGIVCDFASSLGKLARSEMLVDLVRVNSAVATASVNAAFSDVVLEKRREFLGRRD